MLENFLKKNFDMRYSMKQIIKGVPHIYQKKSSFCHYASLAMIFRYYGIDVTIDEVLHDIGAGHAFVYQFPFLFDISSFYETSNMKFLSEIYGVSYKDIRPKIKVDKDKCWKKCWSDIKYYIKKNIPIECSIDPNVLEYNKNNRKETKERGGHFVVITGYDEHKDGQVFFKDPNLPIEENRDGKSISISKRVFRQAVEQTIGNKYWLRVFEKKSNPYNIKERNFRAHERNMNLMKGISSTYEKKLKPGVKFGVKGLKLLKNDLRPENIAMRLPIYKINDRFVRISCISELENFLTVTAKTYEIISDKKNTVSNYSMINSNESSLLKKEGDFWSELCEIAAEIGEKNVIRSYRSVYSSKNMFEEMREIVDKIIKIEENIISQ